jgi:hypothetical protein
MSALHSTKMARASSPRTSLHAGQEKVHIGSAKGAEWPIGRPAGAARFSDQA